MVCSGMLGRFVDRIDTLVCSMLVPLKNAREIARQANGVESSAWRGVDTAVVQVKESGLVVVILLFKGARRQNVRRKLKCRPVVRALQVFAALNLSVGYGFSYVHIVGVL